MVVRVRFHKGRDTEYNFAQQGGGEIGTGWQGDFTGSALMLLSPY